MRNAVCFVGVFAVLLLMLVAGCPKPAEEDASSAGSSVSKPVPPVEPPVVVPEHTKSEPEPELKIGTTVENLQAALNGESSAKARYTAFAEKADEEGYKGVAALYRAAARAEGVHAQSYVKLLRTMGAEPRVLIDDPVVKTTSENLTASFSGETFEQKTMYPGFVKQAEKDDNKEAAKRFKFAGQVEAAHAVLFKQAKDNLEAWRDAKVFYVCPECGNTVENPTFDKCPICLTPKKKFIKVE